MPTLRTAIRATMTSAPGTEMWGGSSADTIKPSRALCARGLDSHKITSLFLNFKTCTTIPLTLTASTSSSFMSPTLFLKQ